MKVALVHDWLVSQRGGENVLLEIARLFPNAPIFTLVHQPGTVHPEIEAHPIRTSFIQNLPGTPQRFRHYLPLFPRAIESFDLSPYDLVISSSHCVAKGVLPSRRNVHLAYVHTPMRYVWDQLPHYVPDMPARQLGIAAARLAAAPLRAWDAKSAKRPDLIIANSHHVAQRIMRVWRRPSEVLHPPVDVDLFGRAPRRERRGYVVVSALVPYKRVDLAVRAATARGLELEVIGDGPERAALERVAGPTVRFRGAQSPDALRDAYAGARALLFPGVEDFGIVPVEAMAAGCPVVAYRAGGALETVQGGTSGVFFHPATVDGLLDGIERLEKDLEMGKLTCDRIRSGADRFARSRFVSGFQELLERLNLGNETISRA
jgi:glycosyltransferase involved in cell wall biosynthesis